MLLKTKLCQTERNQSRPRPHQNLLLRKLRRTKIWWRHKLMFQRRRNHLNELSLRHLLLKRQLLLGARSADWSSKQVRRLVKHTTIIVLGSGKVQGNLHLVSQLPQLGGRRTFSHRRAVVNQWRRMSQQWLHWWLLLQQLQIHVNLIDLLSLQKLKKAAPESVVSGRNQLFIVLKKGFLTENGNQMVHRLHHKRKWGRKPKRKTRCLCHQNQNADALAELISPRGKLMPRMSQSRSLRLRKRGRSQGQSQRGKRRRRRNLLQRRRHHRKRGQ
mmetsp:Transcript_8618/g.14654  ORF Transcript_8618/g.14654 Transcript_8618/m.14654 type:complete len:272 (+) Transcript_8618:1535-2350(+)